MQWHDGNNQTIKHAVWQSGTWTEIEYFVRSSVLGGRVVTELNRYGQKQKGYVYLGSEVIAEQGATTSAFAFRHDDPMTGSRTGSAPNDSSWKSIEADPMGVNVGIENPFINSDPAGFEAQPEWPMLQAMGEGGYAGNPNCTRCYLDGIEMGCDRVSHMMEIGAAVFQSQATVTITYTSGRREIYTGQVALPPGISLTLTGASARVAAAWFNFGMPNFGAALNMAVGSAFTSSIYSFDSPQNSNRLTSGQRSPNSATNTGPRPPSGPNSATNMSNQAPKKSSTQPLSPCVMKIFEQVFTNGSLDLSQIRLHTGIPWAIRKLATISPGAVTTGRDIYFKDGWRARYDADHIGGLTTMAEELWHSLQAKNHALWIRPLWADIYLAASARAVLNGGHSYHDNEFEIEAKAVASIVNEWMGRTYGQDPCAALGLSPY